MKDIKAILEGITLTDEEREGIIREVGENYRTVVEVTKKAQRIEELESQNRALTEQVGAIEGKDEELKTLRETIDAFEKQEEQRKANELESAKRDTFRAAFDATIGDRAFANDMIRETIFERAYKECGDNLDMNVKDAIDSLTKDVDGIWKNPQRDIEKMPDQNGLSNNKDHELKNDTEVLKQFMFGKQA